MGRAARCANLFRVCPQVVCIASILNLMAAKLCDGRLQNYAWRKYKELAVMAVFASAWVLAVSVTMIKSNSRLAFVIPMSKFESMLLDVVQLPVGCLHRFAVKHVDNPPLRRPTRH